MIDVIIPAYNCRKTLDRTLGSLIAQTDNDFQVTIVDDCSTENIFDIVHKYKDVLHISYIRNETNMGCGMSRQVGIDNTNCKHFCFLDSDDVLMPYAIESFNAVIAANPDIEYVHSYFYEQTKVDNRSVLIIKKDGFTWCHGKLYNRDLITKYNIRNSPKVRWADDTFFNSMCSELMEMQVVALPTMIWCNNSDSVMRKPNPERDSLVKKDFLTAIALSSEFVLKHKNNLDHLKHTVERLLLEHKLDEEETAMLNQIVAMNETT